MYYNIALIGGDFRYAELAEILYKDENFKLKTFAVKESAVVRETESESPAECIENADIIVAPAPISRDSVRINAPFYGGTLLLEELLDMVASAAAERKIIFICGGIPDKAAEYIRNKGVICADILKRDDYAVLNAIPTGEGVLQAAMENLPVTVHGLKTVVTGAGRVGRVIAGQMKALGADITLTARSSRDIAWAESERINVLRGYDEEFCRLIETAGLIVNTVPFMIFDAEKLSYIKNKDCLIIDVASDKGGVDFEAADVSGIKTMHLLSLPGKVAPVTAAQYIKRVICNILSENMKGNR